jgi:hypothetical protein
MEDGRWFALGSVALVAAAGLVRTGSRAAKLKGAVRGCHFAPKNVPRKIRIYDNGGETGDRYTVVFTGNYPKGRQVGSTYLHASEHPYGPNGIGMMGEWLRWHDGFKHDDGTWQHDIDQPRYSHLGRKIGWRDLPKDVRQFVLEVYGELWKLEPIRYEGRMPIFCERRTSFRSELGKKSS